jgi:thymidylate kinase
MLIAFSGIDGSGKTTQAQYVTSLLQLEGLQVHYVHITRWTLVNRLARLIQSGKMWYTRHGKAQPRNDVFTLTRHFVSLLDVIRFRVLVTYQNNIRRRVVVCDRFFYDLVIHALYTGVMSTKLEHFYWRVVPSPTILILLDVPPEIAQQREGEHNQAYYQTKRKLYLERAPLWGAIVINAIEMKKTQQMINQILRGHLENNFD